MHSNAPNASATLIGETQEWPGSPTAHSPSRLCFRGEAHETHLKGQKGRAGSWLQTGGSGTAVLTSCHRGTVTLQFLLCSVLRREERTAGLGQAPCLWLYDTL